MKKKATVMLVMAMMAAMFHANAQEKYAVLVTGDYAGKDVPASHMYNGGEGKDPKLGYDEFWNDTYLMWEMLVHKKGYDPENVFVLFADGVDFPATINEPYWERYTAEYNNADHVTDYAANSQKLTEVFNGLENGSGGFPKVKQEDFLFVWTFDHGGGGNGNSTIYLIDGAMTDDEFAALVNPIEAHKKVYWMQQCYSGGFHDELEDPNTYFFAASQPNESAYRADNNWYTENEVVNGQTYNHGEFNFHVYGSANGESPIYEDHYASDNYALADVNSDNVISMSDVAGWESDYETGPATPLISDLGGIGAYTSLEYPTILHGNLNSMDCQGLIAVTKNAIVMNSNTLEIAENAQFLIKSGNSLHINPQATVIFAANAGIQAEINSEITVEGTLRLTNQQLENIDVEIKSGGKLIITDDVTFNANTNLIVQQGGVIESANGASELTICGAISLSSGIQILNFTESNAGGITYKGTGAFDLVQAVIKDTRITASFRYNNPQIQDCNFANSPLYLVGVEANGCSIENNQFSGAVSASALKVEGFPTYTISNNVFSHNQSHAISLYKAGRKTYRQHLISNNTIHHNSDLKSAKGIVLYASVADIRDNIIHNNVYGLGLYHNSSVRMWGDPEKASQQVYGNSYIQIFAADNSFPWYFKWNIIQDAGNSTPIIYCQDYKNVHYDVSDNCWGDKFNPNEDLYPTPSFTWLPAWDCGINAEGSSAGSAPRVAYETSLEQIENEDYAGAETQLQSIVETWPDSKYAVTAMKTMPDVAVKRDNIDQLINYFNTNASIEADEELRKLAGYLTADCHVIKTDYQQALDFYAGIIDNPPTPEDETYAIIDAGYVQFLMEEGDKAQGTFKHAALIPKTKQAYAVNRKKLLDEIGGAIKPQTEEEQTEKPNTEMLAENRLAIYPHPAGNEATISYHVTAKSDVVIQIWNTTGQQVYSETLNTKTTGMHHHTVATTTLPQGVYVVRLQVNSVEQATKRLIINR
jgi:hypothetical protein